MAKKSFKNAIDDKTKLGEKSGVNAVFSATINNEVTQVTPITQNKIDEPQNIRQSFVIQDNYLDKLKDFIHLKKTTSNPYYNQKEALQEALDLLFDTENEIPVRPKIIRLQEEARNKKIRLGIKKK
jgi:hypothetical protein